MPFATLNHHRLFYQDTAPNENPLVLIHGFPLNHSMWQPQIDFFKNNYRILSYDVWGHGQSPAKGAPITLESHANDLLALLDYVQIKNPVVLGLSMGGYIALRALQKNPRAFRALVLCDTRAEADTNEGKIRRAQAVEDILSKGVDLYANQSVPALVSPSTFKNNPSLIENLKNMMHTCCPLDIAHNLMALAARTDSTTFLPEITIPTLILVGQEDLITPPTLAQNMHQQIKKSHLVIIPKAGHMSNLENPQTFNQAVADFLTDLK